VRTVFGALTLPARSRRQSPAYGEESVNSEGGWLRETETRGTSKDRYSSFAVASPLHGPVSKYGPSQELESGRASARILALIQFHNAS